MIGKQDILDRAAEWGLRPEIVEKDYVLGWVLAAVGLHPVTSEHWVFKGGTCLKKCYFETYRFSEDLDFTLRPSAPYTEEDILSILRDLAESAHDLCGVEFPPELVTVRERKNRQGERTFQGKIAYRGPLRYPGPPRILFDITRHEPLVDLPVDRAVFHAYPDALPSGTAVVSYSMEELLAEKTRALLERTRPRDLYDVVFILDNQPDAVDLDQARSFFHRKCGTKGLAPPTRTLLVRQVEDAGELRSEWENMLGHQLPQLPPLTSLLSRIVDLLEWIEVPAAVPRAIRLASAPVAAGEAILAPAGIQYSGTGRLFEQVRFAGANRLMVEFEYHRRRRVVEPYSFRRASTGNVLLYGWEQAAGHIKAFITAKIRDLHVSASTFVPKYRVEFSTGGSVFVPPTRAASRGGGRSSRRSARSRPYSGPIYVFECPYCQRRFRRRRNRSSLRPHKTKDGWDCSGRRAYLLRIE